LRAPLRAMVGFSRILEEELGSSLSPQAQANFVRIRTNGVRMGELIDGLLDLARVSKTEVQLERVDLSSIAREIVGELKRQEPQRSVECVIGEGLVSRGDARLIRALLENLLSNAWKFTGKAEAARIEVSRNSEGAYYVKDNGAGFDMAYASKLFGVFQRLHRSSEFPGTGVGLATVQRIARRHNGRAWADAAPGHGATFFFTLPS
jgi:light-regulated signal transduction histidine kinase (bacteriophytochrome)